MDLPAFQYSVNVGEYLYLYVLFRWKYLGYLRVPLLWTHLNVDFLSKYPFLYCALLPIGLSLHIVYYSLLFAVDRTSVLVRCKRLCFLCGMGLFWYRMAKILLL